MSDAPQVLDWRDRTHWSRLAKPCQHCGGPTHLRDQHKKPSHKTCAEQVLNPKEPA